MRPFALCLSLVALAACGSEDNVVTSGFAGAVISPVRSSLSAAVTFTDTNGVSHPQWVIAMTDGPDLCTKVTAHPDYFRNPMENFVGLILWVPPGKLGTFFVGVSQGASDTNNEVLIGFGPPNTPQVVRLPGIGGAGANISLTQFNVGAGGEAVGNFDVLVSDPSAVPREFLGKFKATYCPGAGTMLLP
jgi:hypothetical protein